MGWYSLCPTCLSTGLPFPGLAQRRPSTARWGDVTQAFGQATLEALLSDVPFVAEVHYLSATTSTNDVLKSLAADGAPEGTVVVTDEQTAGRGRLDRRWIAPPASSLLLSLLFRPALPPRHAHALTMLCSLSVRDAVRQLLGLEVGLKWPNDVLHQGRKLGGLLTEVDAESESLWYGIVGIGVNVNWDPSAVPALTQPATSLSNIVGKPVSRGDLLRYVLQAVSERYDALKTGMSPVEEWEAALETIGQQVVVGGLGEEFEGLAVGVEADGALLVRTPTGQVHRVVAGDVRVRPAAFD